MKADLHVHSHFSDGSDSVKTVMKKASENGVTQISFVDHDTVSGMPEMTRLGNTFGITVIPGIEISAFDFKRNRKVHVLGYDYRPKATNIKSICNKILYRRQAHSLDQIEKLKAVGYELDIDAIVEAAKPSTTIYKQHIMKQLTDAPYTSPAYKQLYQQLFKGNGVAAGDITYIDAFEAVQAITADGGIPVVAHPGQLDSYAIIPELVEAGLVGIERNHPDHGPDDYKRVEDLANAYNLIMTGGTDYHGTFGEAIEVGDITSPSSCGKTKSSLI
ncbi:PHP domain-containing protein [Lentibacillus cibarius]|uniref:PHP domain-containing protein n=1 Tax=Lentibacillus cibarius TaxID=2583219 RepID=A0A5S3QLK4_9BACI|nr:PHP domain-containing protein [Lentibacillus cibarius]TMN22638.1 PHP domain-containing protein [Lentibacillus cibarius]